MIAPPFTSLTIAPFQWAVLEVACVHGFVMAMLLIYQWQWKKAALITIYLGIACLVGALPHYYKELFAATLLVNLAFGALAGVILRYARKLRWMIVLVCILLTYPVMAFIYPSSNSEGTSAYLTTQVFSAPETWGVVLILVAIYALAYCLISRYGLLTKKVAYWKSITAILALTPIFMGFARFAYSLNKRHSSLADLKFLIAISGFSIGTYWALLMFIIPLGL